MEKRTFSKWVEHINMNVTHTYTERNGKLYVCMRGSNGETTCEVPKGESVEEHLFIKGESEITVTLPNNEYLHVDDKKEMTFLEQYAGIKIKYVTADRIKALEVFKALHKEKTEELRKVFNEQGFLILSDIEGANNFDNPYALEIVVSGRSFRIYIDIIDKKVFYQIWDSRNPLCGQSRKCKKIETLLKQLKTYSPPNVDEADIFKQLMEE